MLKLLDCTLRDGGYYNNWDFSQKFIEDYLIAMQAIQVDFVEIGFRTLKNSSFKGSCAFSTDSFLESVVIPSELKDKIGVMVNGSELIGSDSEMENVLSQLFSSAKKSPVTLVRIACHVHEFEECLKASIWLKEKGYLVGFNLMQIAERSEKEIEDLARKASKYPIDVLYFADSMGSLGPTQTAKIVNAIKLGWNLDVGIHTHDNMGMAQINTLEAISNGVTWVDCTVTGMGRGPGNAKTETLVIDLDSIRNTKSNLTKLLSIINKRFLKLKERYKWGTNPFYFLAGKYGIHPSYIQEMLADNRYDEEDVLSVIEHLKGEKGKNFNFGTLEAARHFYSGESRGEWSPSSVIEGRKVLILGAGPGVKNHQKALELFIRKNKPYVIALNTETDIDANLINARACCHPVRLLTDAHEHTQLPQPLITPFTMLPGDVQKELSDAEVLDFGLSVKQNTFLFRKSCCTLPSSLVISYALAIATSGKAKEIYLAGFDGYSEEDPRKKEVEKIFQLYNSVEGALSLTSITPTLYEVSCISVYALTK